MATNSPALVSHAPLRSSNRLYTVSHTLDEKSWHSKFPDLAGNGSWQERKITGGAGIRLGLAETLGVAPEDAGATAPPTDRRLCGVRRRARPTTLNRFGGRACDRARYGRTRPCLFGSDLSEVCRRGDAQRDDGGLL